MRASTRWPLTFPAEVRVKKPRLPPRPLRSTTSQEKKERATTQATHLAALRNACIMGNELRTTRGLRRAKLTGQGVGLKRVDGSDRLTAPLCGTNLGQSSQQLSA